MGRAPWRCQDSRRILEVTPRSSTGRRARLTGVRCQAVMAGSMMEREGTEGVGFPLSADGRRSTSALGRAVVVIIGAIAELERSLIVERVRAGMRRARLEGRHIGRKPLDLDHAAICRDRCRGQSLRQIARCYRISTATVQRVLHEHAPTLEKSV